MATRQLKDGRWICYYRDTSGKTRKEYFGRGEAGEREAKARDFEIKASKQRRSDLSSGRGQHTLMDVCQAYLDHTKTKSVSEKFRRELLQLLENHVFFVLSPSALPDQLTDSDFARLVDYYKKRKVSQATINRYLRYLRTIFRYAASRGMIQKNPLQQWQKPKEAPRRLRLTIKGLQDLIEQAEPHLAWALEVLWNLGCRPGTSELTSIRWRDVDVERSRVWIWGSKTQTWRDVPVSHAFLQRLNEKRKTAKTEYLIEYRGRPIKKFRRSVKTAAKRAGLHPDLCLYEVRHLFATAMLQGGGDLAAVSRLLGHASTHMTADVYYGYLQGEKERAVNLLPEIRRVERVKREDRKVVNLSDWKKKKG